MSTHKALGLEKYEGVIHSHNCIEEEFAVEDSQLLSHCPPNIFKVCPFILSLFYQMCALKLNTKNTYPLEQQFWESPEVLTQLKLPQELSMKLADAASGFLSTYILMFFWMIDHLPACLCSPVSFSLSHILSTLSFVLASFSLCAPPTSQHLVSYLSHAVPLIPALSY